MSVSKQDFEAIARIVVNVYGEWAGNEAAELACERIAYDLADYFGEVNPHFNETRFLTACGIQEVTPKEG